MASLGHIAVGMAAARIYRYAARMYRTEPSVQRASWTAMLLWAALSFLPDADVIGFGFGVRYEDPWGHRGATHSLVFALALGTAIGLLAPLVRRPAIRTGVTATLVVASHAVLDTFTNGGLGCALFWPFDLTRYFAPWTPIPVSPIGLSYFSPYGMYVAATELMLFAPIFWIALTSRKTTHGGRRRGYVRVAMVGMWVFGVWLLMSSDPVRERVVTFALQDATQFTSGFSEDALGTVERGDSAAVVHARLGEPYYELLVYEDLPDSCIVVRTQSGAVVFTLFADACSRRGVRPGVTRDAVLRALGAPRQRCWLYSRTPDRGYYRARIVCFEQDRVAAVIRRWVKD